MSKHPTELIHDFRYYYTLNAESIGSPELSYNAAMHLIRGLQAHPESMLVTKLSGVDKPASRIEILLIQIQHTLVDLLMLQVNKKDKPNVSKLKISFPEIAKAKKQKKIISKEESKKRLAFSRMAETPTKED